MASSPGPGAEVAPHRVKIRRMVIGNRQYRAFRRRYTCFHNASRAYQRPLRRGRTHSRPLYSAGGGQYLAPLEHVRAPYVVRPFHLHDFLEKVSDLLVEVQAIEGPIRQVRREFGALRKKKKLAVRSNAMFASRDSYSYTDEELAEYEKQESEASKTRRNKPRTNLGGSDR